MRFSITITSAVFVLAGIVGAQLPQQSEQPQQPQQSQQPEQPQQSQQPQQPQQPQEGQEQANNTIFQILNSTDGSSPSYQLMQFLQSSPDYQPIIDILNDPNNNVTLFVPSDQVYYNITGQEPNNSSTGDNTSSVAGPTATGGNQQNPTAAPTASDNDAVPTFTGLSDFLSFITAVPTAAVPTAAAGIQARYVKLPLAEDEDDTERFVLNEPYDNNLVMRALKGYDTSLVRRQQEQQQPESNNDTMNSNDTMMSNYTTSSYYQEFTALDLMYYHLVNGSVTLNDTVVILNSMLMNSTVDRLGYGSPLLVQPGNDSALVVGTGAGYNATINQTIEAGNGMIYVIDKVLVPPVNTTQTLEIVQNASTFYQLLEQNNSTAVALNDATNYTIFVPINSALQNVDASTLDNQTLNNIVQAHVFPGVYYSTNFTGADDVTAQSSAGTNVTIQTDSQTGALTVNGTNVVQANILMNNGVIHLIDGILNYTTPEQQPEDPGANPSESTSDGVGPFPVPTNTPVSSSVITASISTLVSTGVMLSTTFFLYSIYA